MLLLCMSMFYFYFSAKKETWKRLSLFAQCTDFNFSCQTRTLNCNVHLPVVSTSEISSYLSLLLLFFLLSLSFCLSCMHTFHVIRSHTHTSFLCFNLQHFQCSAAEGTNRQIKKKQHIMSFCQSVRYSLGIYAICFLLNGIASVEDTVREQYTVLSSSSKAAIEPEGKIINACKASNCISIN